MSFINIIIKIIGRDSANPKIAKHMGLDMQMNVACKENGGACKPLAGCLQGACKALARIALPLRKHISNVGCRELLQGDGCFTAHSEPYCIH